MSDAVASGAGMRDRLLVTKLVPPAGRASLVARPRLLARLDEGRAAAITLVAAPPGSGKSTVVAEWARRGDRPVAWLSLDAEDNDPARFARYLAAAIEGASSGAGADGPGTLPAAQDSSRDGMLGALPNALAALSRDIILVLDDYHAIEARPIHDALAAALIAHRPTRVQLVIASRADPPFALARLRARGELVELRAADLRFTPEEAAAFLTEAMGLRLSSAQVAALEGRAEGWIAGLQLAALSLRGHRDPAEFIRAFTGSHRHVLDYLAEEVLDRQLEEDRRFLLQTSILERLTAELSEALTGRADGQATLERLERDNLFLIPLDEERAWYRYHHLFAEFLRNRLRRASSALVPELHERAANWYASAGLPAEAVGHALAAGASERAAELIEGQLTPLWGRGELVTLRRWLDALSGEVVRARPRLALALAESRLFSGEPRSVELNLQAAEQALRSSDAPHGSALDTADLAGIAAMRSVAAALAGDASGALALAREALAGLPPAHRLRAVALLAIGVAHWLEGDVGAADPALAEAADAAVALGHPYPAQIALAYLAETRLQAGRPAEALAVYERALRLAPGPADHPPESGLHIGPGAILYERNDLADAEAGLRRGIADGERRDNVLAVIGGLLYLARVELAQGDPAGASRLLERAVALAAERRLDRVWVAPSIHAHRVRLWLSQGQLADAARWSEGLIDRPAGGPQPAITREAEQLARARVLLAQGLVDEALGVLDGLSEAAARLGRVRTDIEIDTLRALALQARGGMEAARRALDRALSLAAPGGFARVFLDEAPAIVPLLRAAAGEGAARDYARHLLAALAAPDEGPAAGAPSRVPQPLPEPLTERELAVLRLLATGASNQEIADRAFIAVNTVKKHLKNVFGKLEVSSRTQAVARARDLGLL